MAPRTPKTETAEKVEIVYVNHTRDHVPGDRDEVDVDEARRLVRGHAAQYATKAAAKEAGDPDGPTPRSS